MGKRERIFTDPKKIIDLLKATWNEWNEDKAPRLGAALAYYTAFSIAPLLLIIIAIAGLIFGEQAARGQIVGQIQGLVGEQGAQLIQTMLQNAQKPSANLIASIIGIVTLVLGALGVFGQLQDALNVIWEVAPKPGRGIVGVIKDRLLSFSMVIGTGFLLMVSLVLSAGVAAAGAFFGNLVPGPALLLEVLNFIISFAVITLMFAVIYKYLPDAKIAWSDVWVGAAATALLFTIGKFAIGWYMGRSTIGSTYGAAGSLAVLLIWVYYSAQILFFGAEFTQVYANQYGSHVVPAKDALSVTEAARAEQGMLHTETVQAATGNKKSAKRSSSRTPSDATPVKQLSPSPPKLSSIDARPNVDLSYQRNVAALLGFIAGAIAGARAARGTARDRREDS